MKGGKVALGAGDEVLDLFSQTLDALVNELGNLGLPLVGKPIYTTLKSKVDAIKGTL